MDTVLAEAQDIFLDRINRICNKFGLNSMMAQLYAILYLSNRALSLNDMVERLKISKGSVSVNVRALERYGAVRRVWIRGSRKDYYEAETNISKVIIDRAKVLVQMRLIEIDEMIKSAYAVFDSAKYFEGEKKREVDSFIQRIKELENFYNQAQSLFNLFNSGMLSNMMNNRKD